MNLLAYIDVRPLLFLAGLPLFIVLTISVCKLIGAKVNRGRAALISSLVFTGLFAFFVTGFGPFVDQKESREYLMTWEIKPPPSEDVSESEVVFSFVDYPDHYFAEYSDELAAHLRSTGQAEVKVVFEVTSDYGKVRGYSQKEIAGLKNWGTAGGYGGSRGDPRQSPWDR